MTAYEVYLVGHIVGAMVWVGSAFVMLVLGERFDASREPERCLGYARDAGWLGLHVIAPSSLATLVFGVLLVLEGPWELSQLWVLLGVAVLVASTVIGVAVFAPGWAAVVRSAETDAMPDVLRRLDRLRVVGWLDLGLLAAAVWAMSVKPRGSDVSSLVAMAALPVALAGLGLVLSGRRRTESPSAAQQPSRRAAG